jgi:glycosyltransferase involved in cell wall biosynthesis
MGLLPTHPDRRAFVSWWKYTSRPVSFSRAMDAENYFFAQGEKLGLLKYIPRSWCCFWTLARRRPRLVFASNPPTFCPLVVWFYCLIFDARYCMDSHTSAFDRIRWTRLMPLHAWLARRAIWAATTNQELTGRVDAMGAHGVSVEDIPFDIPKNTYRVTEGAFNIGVICSFDVDEPILEIMQAAAGLSGVHFYVTGNPKKASEEIKRAKPENATFTGYLSNDDYAGLLHSVDAVLVLTTLDFTMQRGGSEAITVEKPLITSDFPVLRRIFYKGTVHCDNTPAGIRKAIGEVRGNAAHFQFEMSELKRERQERWNSLKADLESRIGEVLRPV